jgi:transglutaminase-like putative cysteine protease
MRLDIRYVTRFDYGAPVVESQNELRACPASDEHQQVVHYRVTTTPAARVSPTSTTGGRASTRSASPPRTTGSRSSRRRRSRRRAPEPTHDVPLVALEDAGWRDAPRVPAALPARRVGRRGRGACARAAADAGGAGDVRSLIEAVESEVGVARVPARPHGGRRGGGGGAGCRRRGVPGLRAPHDRDAAGARRPGPVRVGLLLHRDDRTGAASDADEVEVETHAWVEAAVPGFGWWAIDPTNRSAVGERHVTIGRGRDYDDVAPLRGVFNGAPEHRPHGQREDAAARARAASARPAHPGSSLRSMRRSGLPRRTVGSPGGGRLACRGRRASVACRCSAPLRTLP